MFNLAQIFYSLPFFKSGKSVNNPTVLTISPKVARIKSGTRHYSRGDDGTSEFIKGIRLPKHSSAHKVYGEIESSKWTCSRVLLADSETPFLEDFEKYQLQWFLDNLHSLGAFCFNWGRDESVDHIFPIDVLDTIEERIRYFQSKEICGEVIGDCEDFVSFKDRRLLLLEMLRMTFRSLESNYVLWHSTLYGLQKMEGARLDTQALLNRCSTYVFWATRYYALKLGIKENIWEAKVGSYNPPRFEVEE